MNNQGAVADWWAHSLRTRFWFTCKFRILEYSTWHRSLLYHGFNATTFRWLHTGKSFAVTCLQCAHSTPHMLWGSCFLASSKKITEDKGRDLCSVLYWKLWKLQPHQNFYYLEAWCWFRKFQILTCWVDPAQSCTPSSYMTSSPRGPLVLPGLAAEPCDDVPLAPPLLNGAPWRAHRWR